MKTARVSGAGKRAKDGPRVSLEARTGRLKISVKGHCPDGFLKDARARLRNGLSVDGKISKLY